jgi:hypothetical protein
MTYAQAVLKLLFIDWGIVKFAEVTVALHV